MSLRVVITGLLYQPSHRSAVEPGVLLHLPLAQSCPKPFDLEEITLC
jgi:hypothetical protein